MIGIIRKLLNMFTKLLGLPYIVVKKTIEVLYKAIKEIINILIKSVNKVFYVIKDTVLWIINTIIKVITVIFSTFNKVIFGIVGAVSKVIKAIWKYFVIGIKYIPSILKGIGKWFIAAVKESIAQIFTLLGFFIAWLTLTGSAKDIVGIAILISTALWLLTIGLREDG